MRGRHPLATLLCMGSVSHQSRDAWRLHFSREIEKLHALPAGTDSYRAHEPKEGVFEKACVIVDAISRRDMPLPLVAAGSDGSIEVTWRRNKARELSCFIEPDVAVALLVRDGKTFEKSLDQPDQINEYVSGLFD